MRGDHQLACVAEAAHCGCERLSGIPIESRERFVEEVDFGPLCPSTSEEGALLLTTGEGGNLTVGEILEVANKERLIHGLAVFGPEPPPVSQCRIAPHFHKSANRDRKIPVHRFALRHIGDRARGVVAKLVALETNMSGLDRKQAGNGFEECRLTGAIRPEQCHTRTAAQRGAQMVNRRNPAVAHGQILNDELMIHFDGIVTTSSTTPVPQKVFSTKTSPPLFTSTRSAAGGVHGKNRLERLRRIRRRGGRLIRNHRLQASRGGGRKGNLVVHQVPRWLRRFRRNFPHWREMKSEPPNRHRQQPHGSSHQNQTQQGRTAHAVISKPPRLSSHCDASCLRRCPHRR